jgi:uncharacterized membrane protein YqjE
MAIIQAIVAFIGRSAGKILNAIFGWSVRALFGATSGGEQTLLTGVVAMAAVWPLLVLGVVAPRIAAFLVAFVPIPKSVSEWTVRAVWIALAIAVPAIVGIALAAKRPAGSQSESRLVRLARGYPTTLALACAFWVSFVTVPLVHLAAIVRGRSSADVPLVTDGDGYDDVAARVRAVLDAHGFDVVARAPAAWVSAPMTVLRTIGGDAFRGYVPDRLAHFVGPDVEVTLHPNSLMLRGRPGRLAYAQGVIVESLTTADAFQTTLPETQDVERQIRRVWRVLAENRDAHVRSPWLESRLHDIVGDIAALEAPYDEWQIVYRQALQLARALDGDGPLLARDDGGGNGMERVENEATGRSEWRRRPTMELVREVASKTSTLLGKEVELARTELKNDFAAELATLKSLAVAAVAGICMINMLLVAVVLLLIPHMRWWLAAVSVAGVMFVIAVIAGAIGWRYHVSHPLDRTRKTLTDDLRWAKEELA